MTKKQKKVLIRIIIAFLLLIVLHFVPVKGWLSDWSSDVCSSDLIPVCLKYL